MLKVVHRQHTLGVLSKIEIAFFGIDVFNYVFNFYPLSVTDSEQEDSNVYSQASEQAVSHL